MIEEIYLSNVRLFDGPDEWCIPISPLSVFCGTNSSGKSTILKSLLLLCQTNAEADDRARDGRLRFSGALVDLGGYQSFVSHNQIENDILLGVTTRQTIEYRYVRRLLKARSEVSATSSTSSSQEESEYTLRARFRCGIPLPVDRDAEVASDVPASRKRGQSQQAFLKEATFEFRSENDVELSWNLILNADAKSYDILIPVEYYGMTRGFEITGVLKDEAAKQVRIETFMRGILPIGLWAPAKSKKGKGPEKGKEDWSFFPLPPLIRQCSETLSSDLNGIHYLGPLRSPAKRFYMTNLDVVPTMDAAGEFLPYVLRDQRNEEVLYLPPKRSEKLLRKPLKYALDSWMYYLRTGQQLPMDDLEDLHEIDVASMKDVLLEFTLKSFGGESHALADSGFGYSQILPIVVRGLIADPGSTLNH